MSGEQRYFPNTAQDYDPSFGHVNVPKQEVKIYIEKLLSVISTKFLPSNKNAEDGLYLGTAGISYMYYCLSKNLAFADDRIAYLQKGLEYLQPAIVLSQRGNKSNACSFILGSAGVKSVASILYKAVNDQKMSGKFMEQYHQLATYCEPANFTGCGSDELFVGRAGYILGALWLAKESGTVAPKESLYKLCKITINSGREYAKKKPQFSPLLYQYYKTDYLGAAHGLSSILQAILSVPGYFEANPSDSEDVKDSIDYLLDLQVPVIENFPAVIEDTHVDLVQWCHGAPGVFYLMAKAYLTFKDPIYLNSCEAIAELIWDKGLLKKGPGLCHGVAGNGYVFLIMYRLTSEYQYLYRALKFYEFMRTEEFQTKARKPDNPYSLYEGLAGTVCFLADLIHPEQAEFPFMDIF